jgi:oligopeptide/dipeptide ABC transporter ATP-binding protein
MSLLVVRNLVKHFPVQGGLLRRDVGAVHAVDDVNFTLDAGETLALVGESGCGKSTTGRLILRLIEPTSGTVQFDGEEIFKLSAEQLRQRRRHMQIIFQDPYASLNPRMTVRDIIAEPLTLHGLASGKALDERVNELMGLVGLSPYHARRYPHEFSGGQRQRIGIARALAVSPKLIVADEPVSALDVSIQAQIVNLMRDLQRRFKLAYVFIAHDLAVVRHVADRIAVMYLGKIVEQGPKDALFTQPRHPYTRGLLAAVPVPDPARSHQRKLLEGDIASPINPPPGCRFQSRCPYVRDRCRSEEPALAAEGGKHAVACHFWREIAADAGSVPADRPTDARLARLQAHFRRRAAVSPNLAGGGGHS